MGEKQDIPKGSIEESADDAELNADEAEHVSGGDLSIKKTTDQSSPMLYGSTTSPPPTK